MVYAVRPWCGVLLAGDFPNPIFLMPEKYLLGKYNYNCILCRVITDENSAEYIVMPGNELEPRPISKSLMRGNKNLENRHPSFLPWLS
jgi:hypothetical protein